MEKMEKIIFETVKENLEEIKNEKEIKDIADLIYHDFNIADQYEECISEDDFNVDLFYKNYEIYTDVKKFVADWFDGEELSTEQLISKIENYGAGLSVSHNEDLTVFIVDIRN